MSVIPLITLLFAVDSSVPISPEMMRDIMHTRLSALDRLSMRVTDTVYLIPLNAPPLDRRQWYYFDGQEPTPYELSVSVVRPDIRFHWKKATGRGILASVANGTYTELHENLVNFKNPAMTGARAYRTAPGDAQGGCLRFIPLLQLLDIGLHDSDSPDISLVSLFDSQAMTFVRKAGNLSTFAASLQTNSGQYHYECDLDDLGTPMRIKSVICFPTPGAECFTYEQFVLQTQELNGYRVPVEVVVSLRNPNVGTTFGNVHHFVVSDLRICNDLTPESIRIDIDRRNAWVETSNADGSRDVVVYDASGAVVRQESHHSTPVPVDDDGRVAKASMGNLRIRQWLPVFLGFTTLAMGLWLYRITARGRTRNGA